MKCQPFERNVFVREDIKNVILAIQSTNNSFVEQFADHTPQAYKDGFDAALKAIARAFNVDEITEEHQSRALGSNSFAGQTVYLLTAQAKALRSLDLE